MAPRRYKSPLALQKILSIFKHYHLFAHVNLPLEELILSSCSKIQSLKQDISLDHLLSEILSPMYLTMLKHRLQNQPIRIEISRFLHRISHCQSILSRRTNSEKSSSRISQISQNRIIFFLIMDRFCSSGLVRILVMKSPKMIAGARDPP